VKVGEVGRKKEKPESFYNLQLELVIKIWQFGILYSPCKILLHGSKALKN
jgi:hypothetical protein